MGRAIVLEAQKGLWIEEHLLQQAQLGDSYPGSSGGGRDPHLACGDRTPSFSLPGDG